MMNRSSDVGATTPGRWVDAGDLLVGDEVLLRDGRVLPVDGLRIVPFEDFVYNLEVEGLHCYAVGPNSVLVHNDNGLDTKGKGKAASKNEVYRALREGEDPTKGLRARSPGANTNVGSHVMGKKRSDLISTTKDQSKALGKFNSGNGVVAVDLNKVKAEVIDASQGVGRGRVFARTKSHQEVLIRDTGGPNPPIPPEAIRIIQGKQ